MRPAMTCHVSFRTVTVFMSTHQPRHNVVNSGLMTRMWCLTISIMRRPSKSDFCRSNFGPPSPSPKKSRSPHLEHPLSHGRIDLKEIIQSGLAVCKSSFKIPDDPPFLDHQIVDISSWNPREKCSKDSTFLGRNWIFTKFSLDSRPPGLSRSHLPRLFWHSNVPVSVAHLCVVYPHCTVDSREFFSVGKLFKTGLEMGSNQHSCDLFSKEIMRFCTGEEGCPLPNTLVGTMLLFRFMGCKPLDFHTARIQGASQGVQLSIAS